MKNLWLKISLLALLSLGLSPNSFAEEYARGTWDPRIGLEGYLAPRVLTHGPDTPYAAVTVSFSGTATEVYARASDGELWRIERPRRAGGGSLRRDLAIQLPPGTYHWTGFSRWNQRERNPRVYKVLDLVPIPFEVKPNRVNFAGQIHTEIVRRPGGSPDIRESRWRNVASDSFDFRMEVLDLTPQEFDRQIELWPWAKTHQLPIQSALLGKGDSHPVSLLAEVQAVLQAVPQAPPPPPPTTWGHR